jgi:hypothetical protein
MPTIHRLLTGGWAECPAPSSCELKFHFPDMSAEEAQRMPLEVLVLLLEPFDPPTNVAENGSKLWLAPLPNGYHRDYDLPALIRTDGTMEWYQRGRRHRAGDRPAVMKADGSLQWFRDGLLHRENGLPAYVWPEGDGMYWLNGEQVNPDGTPIQEIMLSSDRVGEQV